MNERMRVRVSVTVVIMTAEQTEPSWMEQEGMRQERKGRERIETKLQDGMGWDRVQK